MTETLPPNDLMNDVQIDKALLFINVRVADNV
jgi:hypothetical protein